MPTGIWSILVNRTAWAEGRPAQVFARFAEGFRDFFYLEDATAAVAVSAKCGQARTLLRS
jgi:hypothetical protein